VNDLDAKRLEALRFMARARIPSVDGRKPLIAYMDERDRQNGTPPRAHGPEAYVSPVERITEDAT
jgi:hypothetical protein